MIVRSILKDKRIEAYNVLVELTVGEYLDFAKDIMDTNEFQRKRVIKSKIKEILTEDLLKGCVIPSIVLAISNKSVGSIKNIDDQDNAFRIIREAVHGRNVVIIDGLQRTYVLKALEEDLIKRRESEVLNRLYELTIRAEIYLGLSRIGLLYRMITLNTGQTTMSTRHLMEILYLDYSRLGIDGIQLVKDKDESIIEENTTSYNFKTILDGFNSYIEKTEAIIERTEILDNIKSLEVIKREEDDRKDQQEKDLFKDFLLTYKCLLDSLVEKSGNWKYNQDNLMSEYKLNSQPFGKSVLDIFKKSQTITGFGAAIAFLKDKYGIGLDDVRKSIQETVIGGDDWNSAFLELLRYFDLIKEKSKKIGNDQRFFFKYFFRGLLNPSSDSFHDFLASAKSAYDELYIEKGYKP